MEGSKSAMEGWRGMTKRIRMKNGNKEVKEQINNSHTDRNCVDVSLILSVGRSSQHGIGYTVIMDDRSQTKRDSTGGGDRRIVGA